MLSPPQSGRNIFSIDSPCKEVGLNLEPKVSHVGWVGEFMLLLGDNQSDNVAFSRETVHAPRCATEICHLICEQIRIVDLGAGATVTHTPVWMGGTPPIPKRRRYVSEWTVF